LGQLGEFGLIALLRETLKPANPEVVKGIGDDAAILRPKAGHDWVLTTDMLVEGRHFNLKTTHPWALGAKSISVNLSDCAAMGARPFAAVVSLGIPGKFPVGAVRAFYSGMKAWAGNFGVDIVGGDTVSSDKMVVNVAVLGEVKRGKALTRSGAVNGDALLVTGTLGDSGAGLHSLTHPGKKAASVRPMLEKRHLTPLPRFVVGNFLSAAGLATSCIDVSDGLSSEVNHLASESHLGAEVHEEAVPLSASLEHYCVELKKDPLRFALDGGEDYELLFTVPVKRLGEALRRIPGETGCPVTAIGRMTAASGGVVLIGGKGSRKPLGRGGFDHFGG